MAVTYPFRVANLVNLESVSKSYGVKALLDAVSLGVNEADRIGVVGLNGGGKTTLLEVLTGLEPPDGADGDGAETEARQVGRQHDADDAVGEASNPTREEQLVRVGH